MAILAHLVDLVEEARRLDERRMVVVVGSAEQTRSLLVRLEDAVGVDLESWVAIDVPEGPWESIPATRSQSLLGRTVPGLLLDVTDSLRANVIGQSIGAVEGGGLVVIRIDDPTIWLARTLASDARFAVPPYGPEDVGHRFRSRLLETLHQHRGIAIVDAGTGSIESPGTTDGIPTPRTTPSEVPSGRLGMCETADQRRCVRELDALADEDDVLVVESHRGRGKSSAAGIAAAGFAERGLDVLVTGPGFQSLAAVFDRAESWLGTSRRRQNGEVCLTSAVGGSITYHPPSTVSEHVHEADVLIADEAAAIPVGTLRELLDAHLPVAYLTTVHGYEGTGRGFAVRFREDLEASDRRIRRVHLTEPIRYAPGDSIEIWQFRALLLDARPPPTEAIDTATPDRVEHRVIDRDELVDDEPLLRELFGLLVLAHYRTEPDDLARLLDAPNLGVHALLYDGHPVSVALVAEEGGLDEAWRDRLYRGEPIRGHMLPDLLTTQLRDHDAGVARGIRILRIATHQSVRSRGLGGHLLAAIRDGLGDIDWLGTGYGMTPQLLDFWANNGYRTIHLGTSESPRSGEHSAIMLDPLTPSGEELLDRHTGRLLDRLEGQLSDSHRGLEPETVCHALSTIDASATVDLEDWVWDVVESMPGGPGQVATAPHGFRRLAIAGLVAGEHASLSGIQRELLVRRVLQSHDWRAILADQPCLTKGDAKRALQAAVRTLLEWYRDRDP